MEELITILRDSNCLEDCRIASGTRGIEVRYKFHKPLPIGVVHQLAKVYDLGFFEERDDDLVYRCSYTLTRLK